MLQFFKGNITFKLGVCPGGTEKLCVLFAEIFTSASKVSSWLATSLGVLKYSLTLSTETMLFSISVQERTIQFRTPVI